MLTIPKINEPKSIIGKRICSNLHCSGYIRGWEYGVKLDLMRETISLKNKMARLKGNIKKFFKVVYEK